MNAKKHPKILLVDDDKDMCESLADVLTVDTHYAVDYTTEAHKALEMAEKADFDLIIIDYKMPEMDGLELLKRIKKIKPSLIIFILTAFISNDLITEAKKEGAERVLSKFIWPDEILSFIRESIG